mmetsp:Transcript_69868/g.197982  ORF Transcript_69868/g.197982 Transcript_69868/m.197982 type:complete len:136 (-) Transcript_69868:5-412(-)
MDKCNRKLVGPFLSIHQVVDEYEKTIETLNSELTRAQKSLADEGTKRKDAEDKAAELERRLSQKDEELAEKEQALLAARAAAAKAAAPVPLPAAAPYVVQQAGRPVLGAAQPFTYVSAPQAAPGQPAQLPQPRYR